VSEKQQPDEQQPLEPQAAVKSELASPKPPPFDPDATLITEGLYQKEVSLPPEVVKSLMTAMKQLETAFDADQESSEHG
jgi:hypothetical protein